MGSVSAPMPAPRQMGGKIRKSGAYYLHAGETVFNPRMGRGGGPGMEGGGGSGTTVHMTNNYYVQDPVTALTQERETRRFRRRMEYR